MKSIQKSTSLGVLLLFSLGLFVSIVSFVYLEKRASQEWHNKALAKVEEVSRIFSYWLDIEIKSINNIAATYYSFPTVKQKQLELMVNYYQLASQLDKKITVALISENLDGELYVSHVSTNNKLLEKGKIVTDVPMFNHLVDKLLITSEPIIAGPVFEFEQKFYTYLATLAPNDDFGGILVSLLPVGDILTGLKELYFKSGLSLSLTNNSMVLENTPISVELDANAKAIFSYQQRLFHGGVDWQFQWQVYDNFDDGVNDTLAYNTLFFGITITVLICFLGLIMLRRNESITEQVSIKTSQLTTKNQQLKRAQKQLIEAEKMASVGRISAGMSHELNTPIGIALTGASTIFDKTKELQNRIDNKQLSKTYLSNYMQIVIPSSEIIESNLHRAADLIMNLKKVNVDQSSERRRRFDLQESIVEVLSTMKHLLDKNHIQLNIDIQTGILLNNYPGPLAQIITNLVTNSIIHGFSDTDEGTISFYLISKTQKSVKFAYHDNGCGIADEHFSKIFEPFFTTNMSGGGSGLGLNIVYSKVVNSLHGKIHVESELNNGTTFIIELPLVYEILLSDDVERNSHVYKK